MEKLTTFLSTGTHTEPRVIDGYGATELETMLKERLSSDDRPLRETIEEAIQNTEVARTRSRQRIKAREDIETPKKAEIELTTKAVLSATELFRHRQEQAIPPSPRFTSIDDPNRETLRRLADIGLREFNAQLYIVQSKAVG